MTLSTDIRLMIVSLGGSPEPIRLSIGRYRPEQVIFFASHDSAALAGETLAALDYKPRLAFEITEDPNSLLECFRKARQCVQRARISGLAPDRVMLDYTGGTKVMTAALLLAGIDQRYHYNYVGGDRRDKEGVGVVLSGHERLFTEMSPWAVWAEEERRQIVTLFNRRRYAAVIEIIDGLLENDLPTSIGGYFKFVRQAAYAFLRWDQFELKQAMGQLQKAQDLLAAHRRDFPNAELDAFRDELGLLSMRLEDILTQTKDLMEPHPLLVADLLNNARRQMADKRNDDAAARIYRALELYGQICFRQSTGLDNDAVPPSAVPAEIRAEFEAKYRDTKTQKLKLPLQATFRFLRHSGHEAGERFQARQNEIKKIQSNRNHSILAHGLKPVSDKAVESVFATVAAFLEFLDPYDFPQLP
ncbi:TIGR02710 family CRISPR-associated CARF protein [Desulfatitalea tepidiphila]|uniref:TIGR02710 family CRISPR-associated CARF protein n=1 Tax=Desulfatitalea tepidiphila TaxID=1185843 RepID=UPI000B2B829A|nr:TIGR02710 family CRISPR-associated CARF protein [Desulfatitalea tepidiphila]